MNNIKAIRTQKGMSLEKVAQACVPPTTAKQIQRLENEDRRLTTDWIKRLSKAMNCLPSDIVPEFAKMGELNSVLASALIYSETDPVIGHLLQSLKAAIEEREKK